MAKLKFLVTGSGRSGTNYMSRFLTSVGIMCGHESIFTHDGITEAIYRLS
jgi:LPS sulfotransferase NodH